MLVQNPDRRAGNENCLVVGGSLVAIDFADCFSFLYPLFGKVPPPWEVASGISGPHAFRGTLDRSSVEWAPIFGGLETQLNVMLNENLSWLPDGWLRWVDPVRKHLSSVREHFDEFRWNILRSLP